MIFYFVRCTVEKSNTGFVTCYTWRRWVFYTAAHKRCWVSNYLSSYDLTGANEPRSYTVPSYFSKCRFIVTTCFDRGGIWSSAEQTIQDKESHVQECEGAFTHRLCMRCGQVVASRPILGVLPPCVVKIRAHCKQTYVLCQPRRNYIIRGSIDISHLVLKYCTREN